MGGAVVVVQRCGRREGRVEDGEGLIVERESGGGVGDGAWWWWAGGGRGGEASGGGRGEEERGVGERGGEVDEEVIEVGAFFEEGLGGYEKNGKREDRSAIGRPRVRKWKHETRSKVGEADSRRLCLRERRGTTRTDKNEDFSTESALDR